MFDAETFYVQIEDQEPKADPLVSPPFYALVPKRTGIFVPIAELRTNASAEDETNIVHRHGNPTLLRRELQVHKTSNIGLPPSYDNIASPL